MASSTSTIFLISASSKRPRKPNIWRKCLSMVKQHKTRFYIFGRCIHMLLCWKDQDGHYYD
ncbi:hypothetical protein SAY87_018176 [Trapa incisa]|uniref:Uncharacterized protein n=2 Tax=Trapa TaxID=22665 RepID=A0AAN7LH58_TRANT|nr:hypothetical protein SAY87_018176 [Trapa incisa]KAK4784229.1 hypothetical protein SAY86_018597 [Trapa natans]